MMCEALKGVSFISWNLSQSRRAMPWSWTDMTGSNDWSKLMSSMVYECRAWKLLLECGAT